MRGKFLIALSLLLLSTCISAEQDYVPKKNTLSPRDSPFHHLKQSNHQTPEKLHPHILKGVRAPLGPPRHEATHETATDDVDEKNFEIITSPLPAPKKPLRESKQTFRQPFDTNERISHVQPFQPVEDTDEFHGSPFRESLSRAPSTESIAKLRAAHAESFAKAADLTLNQMLTKSGSQQSKNENLSVESFGKSNQYHAGLEVYHAPAQPVPVKGTTEGFKKLDATGDLPNDIKDVANNLTSTDNIVGTIRELDWSSGTAAVVMIIIGIIMAFFGYRLFKVILFLGGFVFFGGLAYIALNAIRAGFPSTAEAFTNNGALIYFIVVIVVGLLGGGLTVCLWRLGLSVIGGLLGFVLATTIQQFVEGGVIKSEVGRIVFIAIIVIIFAIAIHFLERPLLILGTAFPGSYAVFWGIDVFVRTGFKDAVITLLQNRGNITVTGSVWGMIGGFLGLAVIATIVQFLVTGKKHHNMGRGGYKNLDKESEKA